MWLRDQGRKRGCAALYSPPLHSSKCVFSDVRGKGGGEREQTALKEPAVGRGADVSLALVCFDLLQSPAACLCRSCALGIGGCQHFFSGGCSPQPPSIAEAIPCGAPMLAVSPASIARPTCPLGWLSRAWAAHHFCLSAKLSASSPGATGTTAPFSSPSKSL